MSLCLLCLTTRRCQLGLPAEIFVICHWTDESAFHDYKELPRGKAGDKTGRACQKNVEDGYAALLGPVLHQDQPPNVRSQATQKSRAAGEPSSKHMSLGFLLSLSSQPCTTDPRLGHPHL